MRRSLYFFSLLAIFFIVPSLSFAGEAPHKIAGFTLGQQIGMYVDLVRMETSIPLCHREYLRVVEIQDIEGYKSGYIIFGNCAEPGRIVRIKLKYDNADKKFYDELLERFKERFGEPDTWRGDPFHVIISWKWAFRDKNNHRITLHLQHSTDEEYKFGNSLKLTNVTLMEKERSCYQRKHPEPVESQGSRTGGKERRLKEKDYQRFIPK